MPAHPPPIIAAAEAEKGPAMTSVAARTAAAALLLSLAPQALAAEPLTAEQLRSAAPLLEAAAQAARDASAAVDSFHSALSRDDPKGALALMTDEALVFEDGRVERTKAEYALHHAGADAAFSKAVSTKRLRRSVQVLDDLAWVATESRTRGRFRGTDVDRVMVETMILRRDSAGAWKIVHIHWSSAQPATE